MAVFILFSLFFLIYELRTLQNPSKITEFRKKLDELKKLDGDQKLKMSSEILSSGLSIIFTNLIYFIWCVVGLFIYTHWYLFFFLIFLSFFSSFITRQILYLDKPIFYYKIFDTLTSIAILILIILSFFYPDLYNNLI